MKLTCKNCKYFDLAKGVCWHVLMLDESPSNLKPCISFTKVR
jgi:hypothetical protein